MEKEKKYNYKIIIGLIIGIVLSSTVIYAAILYNSSNIYYSGNNLNSTNVQAAIDELAECPSDKVCIPDTTTLALGDYVSYTPSITSATTNPNKTGYSTDAYGTFTASVQTFNPSELSLWRVININQDGSAEIISVYVSSTDIYFGGLTGYLNLVGYLNELAGYYETSGITSGHRHFGYSNQTQYLTSSSLYTTASTPPWLCSTGGSCSPAPVESQGGGDTGYLTDYNQLQTAFASSTTVSAAIAFKAGTSTAADYWMASRYYGYNAASYRWCGCSMRSGDPLATRMYYSSPSSNSFAYWQFAYALRPIVTLKSGLSYRGVGTKSYPMEIQ